MHEKQSAFTYALSATEPHLSYNSSHVFEACFLYLKSVLFIKHCLFNFAKYTYYTACSWTQIIYILVGLSGIFIVPVHPLAHHFKWFQHRIVMSELCFFHPHSCANMFLCLKVRRKHREQDQCGHADLVNPEKMFLICQIIKKMTIENEQE